MNAGRHRLSNVHRFPDNYDPIESNADSAPRERLQRVATELQGRMPPRYVLVDGERMKLSRSPSAVTPLYAQQRFDSPLIGPVWLCTTSGQCKDATTLVGEFRNLIEKQRA